MKNNPLLNRLQAFKLADMMNRQAPISVLYMGVPHKREGLWGWYWAGWSVEEWQFDGKRWITMRTLPLECLSEPLGSPYTASSDRPCSCTVICQEAPEGRCRGCTYVDQHKGPGEVNYTTTPWWD